MSGTTFFFIFVSILAILFLALNFLLAPHNPEYWIGKSIIREKLPNFGDTLKILIPNIIWKDISGLNNYSGMVTSQNIYESLIGYRRSKPNNNLFVKEQRVDGSYIGYLKKKNNSKLKCTLEGLEISYPVKIPSKPLNFSTTLESNLDPSYVTGFTDGEGSFMLTIIKDNKYKLGWRVACRFAICLHKKDLILLNSIKSFFNTGSVSGKDASMYRVESLAGLEIIINHFIPAYWISRWRPIFYLYFI